jgi:hypothetical protein
MTRWTPARKAKLLRDYDAAGTGRTALMAQHALSADELAARRQGFNGRGLAGLKALDVGARR